jgi:hypothetical protein
MSDLDVAEVIEGFVDGTLGPWDWDDFISVRVRDPRLDGVRLRCAMLGATHPAAEESRYCSDEGRAVLREIIASLRASPRSRRRRRSVPPSPDFGGPPQGIAGAPQSEASGSGPPHLWDAFIRVFESVLATRTPES